MLRCAADLRVPFTNNGSERDIRPLKIRLKVAGCLRTMAGAEAFCRLRSYLSTARKQGQSAFGVLRLLHEGNPWCLSPSANQPSSYENCKRRGQVGCGRCPTRRDNHRRIWASKSSKVALPGQLR